jgi:carbonic anhydrase
MLTTTHPHLKFTHPSLFKSNVEPIGLDKPNPNAKSAITPDQIVDRLVQGNQAFIKTRAGQPQPKSIRLSAVAQGQTPVAAILNYAQLTTSTEELFGQKFGELFAINSPGQLTNSQDISGIEYGVVILGISVVIVLGGATGNQKQVPQTAENSSSRVKIAIERNKILVSGRNPQTPGEAAVEAKTNILARVARLQASPLLARFIQAGDLKIVGGLYDETQGSVTILD